jgi:UDP-N-acetylglucosamine--N-acetylmuramyl-(pentapeptide) pyrophosphoryl-undecaprenol N-acetylglucosamine transferase
VDAGGGLLVSDAAFTADWVCTTLPALVRDADRLAAMAQAGTGLFRRDADRRLAELVLAVAEADS